MDPAPLPIVLTVNQAAALLQLHAHTIRALYRAGELTGNQRGHAIRLDAESVRAWAKAGAPSRAAQGRGPARSE
jgi:excisionase family DNA binding protein